MLQVPRSPIPQAISERATKLMTAIVTKLTGILKTSGIVYTLQIMGLVIVIVIARVQLPLVLSQQPLALMSALGPFNMTLRVLWKKLPTA